MVKRSKDWMAPELTAEPTPAPAGDVLMRCPKEQKCGGWNDPATGEVTIYTPDEDGTCLIPPERVRGMQAMGWSVED